MATTKLYRTFGTPTNLDKWTCSVWVKRTKIDSEEFIFEGSSGASNFTDVRFDAANQIQFSNYNSGYLGKLVTDRLFRDLGAWYHIVAVWDSDNATPGDRMKLYVNGVEETTFTTDTNPSSGEVCDMGSGSICYVGVHQVSNAYFTGVMAHLHFCDGQAYAASDFGETDATSGIWIAKSGPSVTYGDNGLFLKFAAGAFGTDSSGNSNTMTVGGTMTATKDTPDNNFMTWNPLAEAGFGNPGGGTFTNGNTTVTLTSANYNPSLPTFGLSAGLWYFEIQQTGISGTQEGLIGIAGDLPIPYDRSSNRPIGYTAMEYSYNMNNGNYYNNNTSTSYGVSSAQDDIIGVYIDLDANKLYFAKNGTIMNSGTGITITAAADNYSEMYIVGATWNSTGAAVYETNFGNGYFGTTVVTSGVADAGGEGTFEYDPSDGGASSFDGSAKNFRAICTNNIATYGG